MNCHIIFVSRVKASGDMGNRITSIKRLNKSIIKSPQWGRGPGSPSESYLMVNAHEERNHGASEEQTHGGQKDRLA